MQREGFPQICTLPGPPHDLGASLDGAFLGRLSLLALSKVDGLSCPFFSFMVNSLLCMVLSYLFSLWFSICNHLVYLLVHLPVSVTPPPKASFKTAEISSSHLLLFT